MKKYWLKTVWQDVDGWELTIKYFVYADTDREMTKKAIHFEENFERENRWTSCMRYAYRTIIEIEHF